MSNIISIIRKNSPNIRNSGLILSSFRKIEKSENEDIEKSIVDTLSYNESLKIEKTGKEIKESLVSVRINIEIEKDKHYQNMIVSKKEAGIEPMEDYDYYGNLSNRLVFPKIYSYDQRYGKDNSNKVSDSIITYPKSEIATITDEQKEAMNKYNNCAREYVKCLSDLLTIDTLTNNLSDNKKIALSVTQASALGF